MTENECKPVSVDYIIVRKQPMIITLCGSTRFKNEFLGWAKRLTYSGNIILMPHIFGHCGDDVAGKTIKADLDTLHHDKILMSDRIDIICPTDYIGKSTLREIEFAKKNNIDIVYHKEPYCHNYAIKPEEHRCWFCTHLVSCYNPAALLPQSNVVPF